MTQASKLSLEEFNKTAREAANFDMTEKGEAILQDNLIAADPPSFRRNRLIDNGLLPDKNKNLLLLQNKAGETNEDVCGVRARIKSEDSLVSRTQPISLTRITLLCP